MLSVLIASVGLIAMAWFDINDSSFREAIALADNPLCFSAIYDSAAIARNHLSYTMSVNRPLLMSVTI